MVVSNSEVAWTLLCDLAIFCNSLVGLVLWKLDLLHLILLEMVALNVGTLMGVCIIELIPSIYSLVNNGILDYITVTVLYMFGWILGFTIEKLLKRGKGNKYKRLLQATGLDQGEEGMAKSINDKGEPEEQPRVQFTADSLVNTTSAAATNENATLVTYKNRPVSSPSNGAVSVVSNTSISVPNTSQNTTVTFHFADQSVQVVPVTRRYSDHSCAALPDAQLQIVSTSSAQNLMVDTDAAPVSSSGAPTPKPGANGTDLLAAYDEKLKLAKKIASGQDLPLIIIMLMGDMIHDFVDGGVLASAFYAGPGVGLATFIGIFLEEIPHLTSTFAVFVQAGAPVWRALALNLFGASAFLLGGGIVLAILTNPNINSSLIQYLLPFAVGSFQYVALVDLVPLLTMYWHGYLRAATQLLCILIGVLIQSAVHAYSLSQGAAT